MAVIMMTNRDHHHRDHDEQVAVHLVKGGGEQHAADYKKLNPMEQVSLPITVMINKESKWSNNGEHEDCSRTRNPRKRVLPGVCDQMI